MFNIKIGVFVKADSQAFLYIEDLNNKGLNSIIFDLSTELFEAIYKDDLDIIIIDSALISEDVAMISRYRLMSPNLVIVVLGGKNYKTDYLMAGCDFFLNSSDFTSLVGSINILLNRMPTQALDSKENIDIYTLLNFDNILSDLDTTMKDPWRLSIINYHLYTPNGTSIKLTMREFKFLMLLFRNKDTAVNKADITREVIGRNYDTSDQRISLMVTRLRKKVLQHSKSIIPIKADYTNGYLFAGQCFVEKRND